jgi:hypothetical protein
MTRYVYHIEIDRVLIHDAATAGLSTAALHGLTQAAIETQMANAPLPAGRTICAVVQVNAPSVATGTAPEIARAVSHGVARAVRGGSSLG